MRALNLDQLRALVEVVDRGTFSAAARALHLTQPAVSLQVRELEKRFNLRLIERLGKHVQPTAPGRVLVDRARAMLAENQRALEAMRHFQDGWLGRVHISATITALSYSIPAVLKRLKSEHPSIEVVVTTMTTRDSVEAVLENRIDLALVTLPVTDPRLRVTPLRFEKLAGIFATDEPDIPSVVTPNFISQKTLVLENPRGAMFKLVMDWAAGAGVTIAPSVQIGSVDAIKRVVASGFGMSLVPDLAVSPPPDDLIVRPVEPPIPCTLGLIENAAKVPDQAFRIARDILIDEIAEAEGVSDKPGRSKWR